MNVLLFLCVLFTCLSVLIGKAVVEAIEVAAKKLEVDVQINGLVDNVPIVPGGETISSSSSSSSSLTEEQSKVLARAQNEADYISRKRAELLQRETVMMHLEDIDKRNTIAETAKLKILQEESTRLAAEEAIKTKAKLQKRKADLATTKLERVTREEEEQRVTETGIATPEQQHSMQAEADAIALAYILAENHKGTQS